MNRLASNSCLRRSEERKDLKIVFKTYNQQHAMLLPPSLDELILKITLFLCKQGARSDNVELLTTRYKAGSTAASISVYFLEYSYLLI